MNPSDLHLPARIHEIVDAIPIFPYPPWVVATGAAAAVGILGFLVWLLVLRSKPAAEPTAQEQALAALAGLHGGEWSPYEFGVQISDILRRYIDDAFGIRATTATSLEFLESIRGNPRFSTEETAALERFLDTVDLIKFARIEAGGEELESLFHCARHVICGRAEADGGGAE